MIEGKKKFYSGWLMLVIFAVVLAIFFSPVFNGKNGLDYLDNLYNTISKNSAYYIPYVKEEVDSYKGDILNLSLEMRDELQADQTEILFQKSGVETSVSGTVLNVSGKLGKILANCIEDADYMYHNDGESINAKYNYNEKKVLYNWWVALKAMDLDLKKQKKFKEAKLATLVIQKAVEMSYNYYEIEPQKISEAVWVVILSLVFYIIYTVWYGFAYMFIFEGWGLKLEH